MNDVATTQQLFSAASNAIIAFMSGFSVETNPRSAARIADFRVLLRPGTVVYIAFLPGADYKETISVAKRLRDEGFEPAPHFAARSIKSAAEFEDYVARAAGEAGVSRILAIAGSVDKPLGPYSDSMQLLESGVFDKYGIRTICVAGHPEGSPQMSDEAILEALRWKNAFAERTDANLRILTQFCFEAEPIIAWDRMLNAEGNRLPIRIGVPGIANISTLVSYAVTCGIGNSVQFVKTRAANLTNLLRLQAPDKLIRDLATYIANEPNCGIEGVHLYPFGGLKRTANWSYGIADGAFALNGASGFDVMVDLE